MNGAIEPTRKCVHHYAIGRCVFVADGHDSVGGGHGGRFWSRNGQSDGRLGDTMQTCASLLGDYGSWDRRQRCLPVLERLRTVDPGISSLLLFLDTFLFLDSQNKLHI